MRIGIILFILMLLLNATYIADNRDSFIKYDSEIMEVSVMKNKYEAVGCSEPENKLKEDMCLLLKYKIELKELKILQKQNIELTAKIDKKIQSLDSLYLEIHRINKT